MNINLQLTFIIAGYLLSCTGCFFLGRLYERHRTARIVSDPGRHFAPPPAFRCHPRFGK